MAIAGGKSATSGKFVPMTMSTSFLISVLRNSKIAVSLGPNCESCTLKRSILVYCFKLRINVKICAMAMYYYVVLVYASGRPKNNTH